MKKFIYGILIVLFFSVFIKAQIISNAIPISTWCYPDSNTIKGTEYIGISAYHVSGIFKVNFYLDNILYSTVIQETINPNTKEYEYLFVLDTLNECNKIIDGKHSIKAEIISNTDTIKILNDIIIYVSNYIPYKTWYIDCNLGDDNNDGSKEKPWKTLERALLTREDNFCSFFNRANKGDIIILNEGTYELLNGDNREFLQYVTIKPEEGHIVYITGNSIRSSFIKFENINFSKNRNSILIYSHHIWFKNCIYEGMGNQWGFNANIDEFVRSRDNSHDVIVENCIVYNTAIGISLIGQGNYIMRKNHIYNITSDATKIQGENIFVSGNEIHNIKAVPAWSITKNEEPYDLDNTSLTFYLSYDKGETYPISFDINFFCYGINAEGVISQLRTNENFVKYFNAKIIPSEYLNSGKGIYIESFTYNENHYFYITGSALPMFRFSDNQMELNDISKEYPSKHSPYHCDAVANDSRDLRNVVFRNNKIYDIQHQCIKLGVSVEQTIFYKEHLAYINNLFSGGMYSSRLFFLDARKNDYVRYNNILLIHNTIMKPDNGSVKANIGILPIDNEYLSKIFFINNIIGKYFSGDFPLTNQDGLSDYNFFTNKEYYGDYSMNEHSYLGNPMFVNADMINTWNFNLQDTSEAKQKANPSCNIKYDINWNIRSVNPSIGAFE